MNIKQTKERIASMPDDEAIYIGDIYRHEGKRLDFDDCDLKALAASHTALLEAAKEVLGQWHHFEAYDDGDRGWKELGDRLDAAIRQAESE